MQYRECSASKMVLHKLRMGKMTEALNEDLEKCFRAWYPGFRPQKAAA